MWGELTRWCTVFQAIRLFSGVRGDDFFEAHDSPEAFFVDRIASKAPSEVSKQASRLLFPSHGTVVPLVKRRVHQGVVVNRSVKPKKFTRAAKLAEQPHARLKPHVNLRAQSQARNHSLPISNHYKGVKPNPGISKYMRHGTQKPIPSNKSPSSQRSLRLIDLIRNYFWNDSQKPSEKKFKFEKLTTDKHESSSTTHRPSHLFSASHNNVAIPGKLGTGFSTAHESYVLSGEHRATASSGDQVHQELKASREVAQGSGEKKREDEAKHEPRHSDSPTRNKMAIVIFSRKQFKTFLDSLGLDPSRKYPHEKLSVGSSEDRRPWTKIILSTDHENHKLAAEHSVDSTKLSGGLGISKRSLVETTPSTTQKPVSPTSTAYRKFTEVVSTNHASPGLASNHNLEPTRIPSGKQLASQYTTKSILFKTLKPVHLAPNAHEKLAEVVSTSHALPKLVGKHKLESTANSGMVKLAPIDSKKSLDLTSSFTTDKAVNPPSTAHGKITEVASTNHASLGSASKHYLEPTKIPAGKQLAPQTTKKISLFKMTKPVHFAHIGHEKLTELASKHNLEPTKIPAGKQLAPQYTTKSSWYKTLKPVHLAPLAHAKVAEEVSTSQAHSKFVANQNMGSSANPGVIKLAPIDLEESLDVTSPSATEKSQLKLGDVSTDIPPKSDVKHNLEPTSTSGSRNLAPINSKKTIVSPYTTRKPIKPVKLPHAPRKLTVKHNLKLTPINSQRSIESSSTTQKPENTTVKVKGERASDEISKQTPSKYHAKHNLELSSVGQLNETPGEKSGHDFLHPYKQKAHQRHLKHSFHHANRQFMHPLHEPQLYDPSYMFDAPVYPVQDVNPLGSSLPAHMPRRPVYARPYDPLQMYNGLYDQKQNTRHRIYDEYPLLRR